MSLPTRLVRRSREISWFSRRLLSSNRMRPELMLGTRVRYSSLRVCSATSYVIPCAESFARPLAGITVAGDRAATVGLRAVRANSGTTLPDENGGRTSRTHRARSAIRRPRPDPLVSRWLPTSCAPSTRCAIARVIESLLPPHGSTKANICPVERRQFAAVGDTHARMASRVSNISRSRRNSASTRLAALAGSRPWRRRSAVAERSDSSRGWWRARRAARRLGSVGTVPAPVCLPQRPTASVGAAGAEQQSAGNGRYAGADSVENCGSRDWRCFRPSARTQSRRPGPRQGVAARGALLAVVTSIVTRPVRSNDSAVSRCMVFASIGICVSIARM